MSTTKPTATDEQKSQVLQQEYNRYQELIAELDSQLNTISSQLQETSYSGSIININCS